MNPKDIPLDLLNRCVTDFTHSLRTIAVAKFGEKNNREIIYFSRNVLVNLIGNFVLENSNTKIENAIEMNIQAILLDLETWFAQVKINTKKIDKDKH